MKNIGTAPVGAFVTPRKRPILLAGPSLCLGLALAAPVPAQTGEHPAALAEGKAGVHRFDIAGQPLYAALNRLAEQGGIQFVYTSAMVRGLDSPRVSGSFTLEEALRRVLQGSGLGYHFSNPHTITLERKATPIQSGSDAGGATTLGKVTVSAEAAGSYDSSDPYNRDYAVPNATTATKTDTPIMETPVSIQVVPKQVLKDQQAIQVRDALKNVSGTFWAGDFNYDGFQLRGFISDGFTTVYRNGLRLRRALNEVANLEQLEVLKGPAAAIYGRIEPGGLVNLVTKKPLDIPYYALEQQFGSYDLYRTTVDATGPITEDHSLLYRFDLSYTSNGTFIDMMDRERVFIAPTLTWRISDRTEINFNFEYQHDERRYYVGIPVAGRRPAPIPISRFLGFGSDNEFIIFDKVLVGFDWSHQFNDNWKLQNRFHYYNLDYVSNTWCCSANSVLPDGRSLVRAISYSPIDKTDTYATNIDLTGKFDVLGTKHKILMGFDFFHEEFESQGFFGSPAPIAFRPVVDIFNPVYGPIPQLTKQDFNSFTTLTQFWYGTYFQDQITFFDKLHILGGGRYDWTTRRSGSASTSLASARQNETEVQNEAFSPRVGLVYQPWPWLSLYGNYVESLGAANTALAASNKPLDPETAQQHEVGFKTEFFDKKLISTVAFYELTKQNVATADPANPRFSVQTGEARSRGIEVDVSGQVTDGLSLIATYAYTDSEITKDNRGNQGNRFFNVPRNSGSFWAKYDVQDEILRGLSFGSGAYLLSQRQGNNANTWELPGYVRIDAFLRYAWKFSPYTVSAQFNVNNLLDKTYFESAAYGGFTAIPGAPRTFMGSIRVEF